MSDAVLLSVCMPPERIWHEFLVSDALTAAEVVSLVARLASAAFEGCPPVHERAELMLASGEDAGMLLDRAATVGELATQGILAEGTELLAL